MPALASKSYFPLPTPPHPSPPLPTPPLLSFLHLRYPCQGLLQTRLDAHLPTHISACASVQRAFLHSIQPTSSLPFLESNQYQPFPGSLFTYRALSSSPSPPPTMHLCGLQFKLYWLHEADRLHPHPSGAVNI
ncbi:hypothetical protein TcWFU_005719 [Taenia crassiceps]|uniref:Uncharacterized protein n=1 Tax=Taenia crassiceps TaxID=6207 RepID=A0ABR4Q6F4_9CEST